MGKKKQRRIGHYSSSQKILLVGEGDFSFSACLAKAFRSATNMVATTLKSQDTLLTEHRSCEEHLEELKKRGCLVLYEVNVYVMDRHPTLKSMKFDVIIFNFPHAGHYHRLCEKDEELIELHRHLSKAFFKSARGMLSKGGEIHVSHMVGYPYDQWKLKELAEKAGLFLKEKVWFNKSDYPGYHSKRAGGIQSNKMFRPNKKTCYTFKFSLNQTSSELSVCNPTTSIVSDGPSPPGYQGYLCPPAPPSPTPSPRLDDYEPPAAPSPPLPPSCQDDDDPPAAPTPPSRQVNEDIGCYSVLRGCLCAIFRCWPDIGRSLL
ncbi:uncharacterized protein At4g26485-like isoform X1 [Pyrus x bretschneideri]|uniref:uncharacterized protein At4g26485-like isoform X1 n=1 Tax=Pyrus x bretschneideri TaxID=225117 RepID=UPI00202ED2C7|nr:uncharacterized protein At4g26485-like isoform X1 [Pyrus x bretschneideri]XP_048434248.1 uncharacterized protein At4g26485-like isoform X1 [Pyrus x bretschneideri]XP_048434249.1 uncharacterized protein At4g26485-like isoform X1 [Pyrus x bretschneideri]XP_048434250.1 uncharacterized protein At4g26485-like isoform X1 [Pyrus x bretschneideri]